MWKLGVVSNQRKGIILANKIILGPVAHFLSLIWLSQGHLEATSVETTSFTWSATLIFYLV